MTVLRLEPSPKSAALTPARTTVDPRVAQVANQTWGVHAVLPAEVAR